MGSARHVVSAIPSHGDDVSNEQVRSTVCRIHSSTVIRTTVRHTAVRSDRLNHGHSQKLLDLLQLVTDDYQRLALFENVEGALLHEGGENAPMREAAGLLSANLGEAMDRTGKHTTDPFVQEAFFRHSIRIFPESPVALRSLGYKFEQSGQELRAMELYREGLARSPERLDLRLLLASSCSPFLDDTPHQGDMR